MTWRNFTHTELMCRCGCGQMMMQDEFMRKLVILRTQLGFPLPVSSGYRCPTHNTNISSTGPSGPHTTGRAVDIAIHGMNAYRLIQAALESHAFTGIGVHQKGPYKGRFVHIDDLDNSTRPWIWSY